MPWWAWVWAVFAVLNAAARVALIGQPRQAHSRTEAVASVVSLPLTIWFIAWVST